MLLNELAQSVAKLLCDIVGEKSTRQLAHVKVRLTGDAKSTHIRVCLSTETSLSQKIET